jgi:hypothetical protein
MKVERVMPSGWKTSRLAATSSVSPVIASITFCR